MKRFAIVLTGLFLGAVAWGLGALLSGTFEPFDSLVGFLTTQLVIGIAAFIVGLTTEGRRLFLLLFGSYLGLNLYPCVLGGPETRAWALLGAITTLSLIVLPAVVGGVAWLVRRRRLKSRGAGAS